MEFTPQKVPESIMLYAMSGSTKTTQAYFLAKYIFETTGKRVRMVHSDGGGFKPFVDSGMIQRGEVEMFDYSYRPHALADIRWISQGYWPRYVVDGKAYPMPIEGCTEYFKKDEVCKTTPEEWKQIGGYIIEGMTSTGEALKTHCSNQTEGVGFKETWKYEEEGETIVGLQQGHYDIVQKEMYSLHMRGFKTLPIDWLIWTALLGKGDDKKMGVTNYGPQLVGNASTPKIPQWFNHVFYLSKETYADVATKLEPKKTGDTKEGYVAWFTKHRDPADPNVDFLAKTTVLPEIYESLLQCFPYGFVPLDFKSGIVKFFKVLNLLNENQKKGK